MFFFLTAIHICMDICSDQILFRFSCVLFNWVSRTYTFRALRHLAFSIHPQIQPDSELHAHSCFTVCCSLSVWPLHPLGILDETECNIIIRTFFHDIMFEMEPMCPYSPSKDTQKSIIKIEITWNRSHYQLAKFLSQFLRYFWLLELLF